MNTSRFSTWLGLWALGCAGGEPTPQADSAPPEPSTAELLEDFYADHGGRDAFPSNQVMALEALLYAQDAIEAGEPDAARARIDEVFAAMPLSTPVWRDQVGYEGLNIGDPVAYYGLRMLDQVLTLGDPVRPETLTMTAVVAPCAEVRRPTLPDLEPETVSLTIAPEILADEARRLHVSTRLFRRWVQAITGGLQVELVVHTLEQCTTVDYTDDGSVIVSYPMPAA